MDGVTQSVARYIKEKGVAVSAISEKTGIPCGVLYPSLRENSTRKLRADEFMLICSFLDIDPRNFSTAYLIDSQKKPPEKGGGKG